MKTTTKVAHPVMDISIFLRENTYLIKIVLNQYEQIYRVKQLDVTGIDDVKKMLDEDFLNKTYMRFVEMSKDFKASFNNINKIQNEQ